MARLKILQRCLETSQAENKRSVASGRSCLLARGSQQSPCSSRSTLPHPTTSEQVPLPVVKPTGSPPPAPPFAHVRYRGPPQASTLAGLISYMPEGIQVVVGEFQLLEGHQLPHPVRARGRRVGVDVEPSRHGRLCLASHHPANRGYKLHHPGTAHVTAFCH